MMAFTSAIFLLGGLAVAVPLALHFLRRKPVVRIPFPSLFFLRAVHSPSSQRFNDLKKWLVLLLRCLAVLALAMAFALPFLPKFGHAVTGAAVILTDASLSMQSGHCGDVNHAAAELVDRLDSGTVVLAGAVGDIAVWSGGFTDQRETVKKFLLEHGRSDTGGGYENPLRQADAKLRKQPVEHRTIYLVTDRQMRAWKNVRLDTPLSPGVELRIVTPGIPSDATVSNTAVDDVRVEPVAADRRVRLAVTLANYGHDPVAGSLSVQIGKTAKNLPVKLASAGKNTVAVELPLPAAGSVPEYGQVRLDIDDDLPADNQYFFPLNVRNPPAVFLTRPPDREPDFVLTALVPDDAHACVLPHALTAATSPEALKRADICLIRSGFALTPDQVAAVQQAVRTGGGLILTWENSPSTIRLLEAFGVTVLRTEQAPGRTLTLTDINFELPPFKKFTETPTGSLYDVVFYRSPQLKFPDSADILARFAPDAPAVGLFPFGSGTVCVLAFRPDRTGTDWPVHASFVPFWHELLKQFKPRAVRNSRMTASLKPLAGEELREVERLDRAGETSELLRQGRFIPAQAGAYRLTTAAGQKLLCVNHDPEESLLAYMPENFHPETALSHPGVPPEAAAAAGLPREDSDSPGRPLFLWFLVLALLCGGGELWLSNRTAL